MDLNMNKQKYYNPCPKKSSISFVPSLFELPNHVYLYIIGNFSSSAVDNFGRWYNPPLLAHLNRPNGAAIKSIALHIVFFLFPSPTPCKVKIKDYRRHKTNSTKTEHSAMRNSPKQWVSLPRIKWPDIRIQRRIKKNMQPGTKHARYSHLFIR